jgi:ubiquinone/menaquinone biosynthesis C-methylase UbiE
MDAEIHRFAQAQSGKPVSSIPHELADAERNALSSSTAPILVSAAEGYERWAPTYDEAPNPLLAREERYLAPLLPSLNGKNVLDLACGTGRWLEMLFARGASSGIGIDVSSAMLQVARHKAAIRGRLARADCVQLPFRASAFDLVICSFALSHIVELRATVSELSRVTKMNADVFVSDLHPEAYCIGWKTGFRDERGAVQIDVHSRPAREIIEVFYSAGFEYIAHVSLRLEEPERSVFNRAEKTHIFVEACKVPAVLVCQFRRAGRSATLAEVKP